MEVGEGLGINTSAAPDLGHNVMGKKHDRVILCQDAFDHRGQAGSEKPARCTEVQRHDSQNSEVFSLRLNKPPIEINDVRQLRDIAQP